MTHLLLYGDKLVLKDLHLQDTCSISDLNSDKKMMRNLKLILDKDKDCLTKKEISYIYTFMMINGKVVTFTFFQKSINRKQ